MIRISVSVFSAGCFGALVLAAPGLAVTPIDDSPPVAWTNTGATAYVQRGAQQQITVIGLMIPAATVRALPERRSEAVYPLANAGLVQTANLEWHPKGHEPEHVYDVPHFDVHFYTIGEPARHRIVPGAAAAKVKPAQAMLPPASMLAPGFVPMMGMHVVAKAQPEFSGGKFSVSPIVGYWNGDLDFFEVMFTRAFLQQKENRSGAFPQPTTVHQHGWYPTRYSVQYDEAKDAYRVQLAQFRQR